MKRGYFATIALTLLLVLGEQTCGPAYAQSVPRDFSLPTPLFSSNSPWNQRANSASVLAGSDQQVLITYRVLRGDTTSLYPPGQPAPTTWPFMDINCDVYSVAVSRMGSGQQTVLMRDYEGNASENNPKLPGSSVSVPAPAGTVRPSGPQSTDADGHLVLYDPAYRYRVRLLAGYYRPRRVWKQPGRWTGGHHDTRGRRD